MTVKEMDDRIQLYCNGRACSECKIRKPCDDCCGDFTNNPTECEEAYKLILSNEDIVNHPNHYTNGGMECIDEMIMVFGKQTVMHFCLCNAWKYRYRAVFKNGEEDIKKSHWYMAKYKELRDGDYQ